jgi:SAM-dependent methyltransferase
MNSQFNSNCPICDSSTRLIKELPSVYMEKKLSSYYGKEHLEHNIIASDYSLLSCTSCSLEFAYPLTPGTHKFYQWITSQSSYYPSHRWEWDVVVSQIKSRSSHPSRLMEVGCGSGKFLELLQSLPNLETVGLDTTDTSVKACQEKGLNVKCGMLESFLTLSSEQDRFDYVVAFHCLEHVPDPKGLVASMLSALKPTGSIFISTPYSPMSFETQWFDPLNYPPHHLTRWNEKAYRELGRQLGLNTNFYMPKASSSLSRALTTLNYSWFGHSEAKPANQILLSALARPQALISEWIRQLQREKVNQKVAANTVLVEFTLI